MRPYYECDYMNLENLEDNSASNNTGFDFSRKPKSLIIHNSVIKAFSEKKDKSRILKKTMIEAGNTEMQTDTIESMYER